MHKGAIRVTVTLPEELLARGGSEPKSGPLTGLVSGGQTLLHHNLVDLLISAHCSSQDPGD